MSEPAFNVKASPRQSTTARQRWDKAFQVLCVAAAAAALLILLVLLGSIVGQGARALNWRFLTGINSADATRAGIFPALVGSLFVCGGCALLALPIGVATAIYLEEFKPKQAWLRRCRSLVQLNITNLAGVPSVVYGILGLTAFVQLFGLLGGVNQPAIEFGVSHYLQYETENPLRFVRVPVARRDAESVPLDDGANVYTGSGRQIVVRVIGIDDAPPRDAKTAAQTVRASEVGYPISIPRWYYVRLPLGPGLLAGSLTLMLVILPMVIIASQEALRAVPDSLREGALGMGATRWQAVWHVSLPSAMPGIMTGAILAMSRAIGEAAPILIISGIVFIAAPPQNLVDDFSVMPLQIYDWAGKPANQGFHSLAAGGIIVLLALLLVFNGIAVLIRQRLQKPLS